MEVVDIYGKKDEVDCLGCAITGGELDVPEGILLENDSFSAQQDYEIPIPGFIIIASKRHIQSVDEFTDQEQTDFIDILVKMRRAMREALEIHNVFLVQVESTEHHFNYWIMPIMKEFQEKFGFGVKSIKPTMIYARDNLKTSENIEKVENYLKKLKKYFEGK